MEEPIFSSLPAVVTETFQLLEEKRKGVVGHIDQSFEKYYEKNKIKFRKIIKSLVFISHPLNRSVIYHRSSEESAKMFFNYWLFTEYSNPNWGKEGINILNILVKVDYVTKYSGQLSDFNDWMQVQVLKQNAAYRLQKDNSYLQEIVQFSNQLYRLLKNMNYLSMDDSIRKSLAMLNTLYEKVKKEKKWKIEALNENEKLAKRVANIEHYNDKWKVYDEIWPELKSQNSVYEAFRKLQLSFPDDEQLANAKPDSFNRAMNKRLNGH